MSEKNIQQTYSKDEAYVRRNTEQLMQTLEIYLRSNYVENKADLSNVTKEKNVCCEEKGIYAAEKDINWGIETVITQLGETFQQSLLRIIDEKGISDVEIYKKANLSRKLFSKIRCNDTYKPTKKTAVSLALALELSLEETKELLGRAGLAFSPSSKFDLIIQYFIELKIYDMYTINQALFQYGQPVL